MFFKILNKTLCRTMFLSLFTVGATDYLCILAFTTVKPTSDKFKSQDIYVPIVYFICLPDYDYLYRHWGHDLQD